MTKEPNGRRKTKRAEGPKTLKEVTESVTERFIMAILRKDSLAEQWAFEEWKTLKEEGIV
jgi:hypothetical protein